MIKPISLNRVAYSITGDILLGQRLFGSVAMAWPFGALETLAIADWRR
jgi:hypothetical protein